MTKEAIKELSYIADEMPSMECADWKEAISVAIKALKQEPIIDKIRAEIMEEMLLHSGTGEETIQAYADGLKKGLDILDKYKSRK